MNSWLAPPLRRFAGTAAMLLAADTAVTRALDVPADLPPVDVDRVVVLERGIPVRDIRDPAAVARIVQFVRGRQAGWLPIPLTAAIPDISHLAFYRHAELQGSVFWNAHNLGASSGLETAVRPLTRSELAELRRLVEP